MHKTKQICGDYHRKTVLVIAVTVNTFGEGMRASMGAGMNAYFAKLHAMEEVLKLFPEIGNKNA